MKSIINNTQAAVKLSRMLLYLSIVILLAFLNSLMVRAGEPETDEKSADTSDHIQLMAAERMSFVGEVDYIHLATAEKMLNLSEDYSGEIGEEPLRFEAWMFNLELLQGPAFYAEDVEEELLLERWMLTISGWELSEILPE